MGFNLSKKAVKGYFPNMYHEEDVKEFIRLLIPDTLILHKKYDSNTVMEVIRILRERQDTLAGDELI